MKRILVCSLTLAILTACGGSSTVIRVTNEPKLPTTLPDAPVNTMLNQSGQFQSDIVAIGTIEISERQGTGNFFATAEEDTGRFIGVFNHNTSEFVIPFRSVTVIGEARTSAFLGRDISGLDHVTLVSENLALPAGAEYNSDVLVTTFLVAGIPTRVADMRTSGTASMTGGGSIQFPEVTSRSDVDLQVNFQNRNVSITWTPEGQNDAFDSVRLDNMQIEGTAFSGGSLTVMNDGSAITPVGVTPTINAEGQFFGRIGAGRGPDEAAGMFTAIGNNSMIGGDFMVD